MRLSSNETAGPPAVRVKIDGCTALRFPEVARIIGARHPHEVAGLADRDSYIVEYADAAEAQAAVAALNDIDGLNAKILLA